MAYSSSPFIELRLTKLAYVRQRIQALGAALLGPEMQMAMLQRGELIASRMRELAPVATRELQKSIYVDRSVSQKDIYVRVGVRSPYAWFREHGTEPQRFPPMSRMIDWVLAVGKADEDDARDVAFMVGRKIAEQGTEGSGFMQKAYDDTDAQGRDMLYVAVDKLIKSAWSGS